MQRLNPTRSLFTRLTESTLWFFTRLRPVKQAPDSKFIEIRTFLVLKQSTCTTCHTGLPKVLPQLYIVKSFHTLFNECTNMFFAPISLRSLSASYFRSFETLNLKAKHIFTKLQRFKRQLLEHFSEELLQCLL